MIHLKAFILFLCIFLTWISISRYLNTLLLIYKTGKARKDNEVAIYFETVTCILWALYIIYFQYITI